MWAELCCMIGWHTWWWGEHRRSGNAARHCVYCYKAQEEVGEGDWVRCYLDDVKKQRTSRSG